MANPFNVLELIKIKKVIFTYTVSSYLPNSCVFLQCELAVLQIKDLLIFFDMICVCKVGELEVLACFFSRTESLHSKKRPLLSKAVHVLSRFSPNCQRHENLTMKI